MSIYEQKVITDGLSSLGDPDDGGIAMTWYALRCILKNEEDICATITHLYPTDTLRRVHESIRLYRRYILRLTTELSNEVEGIGQFMHLDLAAAEEKIKDLWLSHGGTGRYRMISEMEIDTNDIDKQISQVLLHRIPVEFPSSITAWCPDDRSIKRGPLNEFVPQLYHAMINRVWAPAYVVYFYYNPPDVVKYERPLHNGYCTWAELNDTSTVASISDLNKKLHGLVNSIQSHSIGPNNCLTGLSVSDLLRETLGELICKRSGFDQEQKKCILASTLERFTRIQLDAVTGYANNVKIRYMNNVNQARSTGSMRSNPSNVSNDADMKILDKYIPIFQGTHRMN
jgi:hypothetical protein